MKAVICPVCNGGGVFSGDEGGCYGCAEWGSKGWLLVPEQEDLPSPYIGGNDTIAYDGNDTYSDPHEPVFTY